MLRLLVDDPGIYIYIHVYIYVYIEPDIYVYITFLDALDLDG